MAKVDMSHFAPLKCDFGKIHISGGQTSKGLPAMSKQVASPSGESITFVKLASSEMWLLKSTTGCSTYHASAFGRTSLLDDLRLTVQKHCDGEVDLTEGHDVPQDNHAADYDPMAEVEADSAVADPNTRTVGRGVKRTRYYKNHRHKTIVTFPMPVRCPEEDPDCTEMRKIRMYVEDRKQLWLDLADVDWALRYLYVQNFLKGVPLVSDDSRGPSSSGNL